MDVFRSRIINNKDAISFQDKEYRDMINGPSCELSVAKKKKEKKKKEQSF